MKLSVAALVLVGVSMSSSFVPQARQAFVQKQQCSTVAVSKTSLFSTTEAAAPIAEETFDFQADVGKVMNIIINSLYSDRDVFLRELVSNAADACDKKRFLSITSESDDAPSTTSQLEIKIRPNKDENTLIIEDSGVGMTRDELVNNLGRIAQSGTKNFLEALGKGTADVNLIGQFGVGFYASYLVADRVEVITKSMQPNSPMLRWESDAGDSFTVSDADNAEPFEGSSGTRLILHLKEDAADYLESSKVEELLKRYSEFIEFPISVYKETTEYKRVPDVEANKDLAEGEEPKMKTVPETVEGFERLNNQRPIWLRSPKEVTEQEYIDFYKNAFRAAYDEPMKHTHFVLEGQVECKAILYIPGMLPFELSKDMFDENARNIRLYVKRVFINDKFEELMPRWLKFVRGVVDSDDLPLNVGREILQKSKVLSIINKRLVRKSLDMMNDIATDEDKSKYIVFWNNFGKYLKVGVVEDDRNRQEIAPLLRFFSSKSGEEYMSLDEYIEGMVEGQKSIYYVTGDGKENTAMSPVIEKLTSRGYDVLYMTQPLDEICMESLRTYKEFNVVDATKEGLKLDDEDEEAKKNQEELNAKYSSLLEYLETCLAGKVQKVSVSPLLTDSPAALVQGAYGMSPMMQRYMRVQAVSDGATSEGGGGLNQAVMEINPNHPIVKDLSEMVKESKESDKTQDFALLLYDVASMTSGYDVKDMASFAKRVMGLMTEKAETDEAKSSDDDGDEEAPSVDAEVVS